MIFGFGRVLKSAIAPDTKVVLYDLEGVGYDDDPKGAKSELKPGQEALGPLGMYGRPLEPETSKAQDGWTEYLAARTSDGLVAFAFRDRRILDMITKGSSSDVPGVGQLLWGGYGGGFISYQYKPDEKRDQFTIYIPYSRDGSNVPTKAHTISVGKSGDGKPLIAIVSGEGPRLTLLDTSAVLASKDGANRLEVSDDGVVAVGPLKAANGADIGGPASAVLAKFELLADYVTKLGLHVDAITTLLSVTPPAPVMSVGALATTGATADAAAATFLAGGSTLFTKGA